jgi:hypothetical protein
MRQQVKLRAASIRERWSFLGGLSVAGAVLVGCTPENGALFTDVAAPESSAADRPADGILSPGVEPMPSGSDASAAPGASSRGPSSSEASSGAGGPDEEPEVAPGTSEGGAASPVTQEGEADPENANDPTLPGLPEEENPAPPLEEALPRVCPAIRQPLLLDFAFTGGDPSQSLFGDFSTSLSGGTFVYPGRPGLEAELAGDDESGLVSDVSDGGWNISGVVASQSGFGLFFDCQLIDLSDFAGIAFRIEGEVESLGEVTLIVGTASNDVSSQWLVESGADPDSPPSFGRCSPVEDRFDGTCNSARIVIPVTRRGRDVVVRFDELAQGSPEATVDPAEITAISWSLPAPSPSLSGSDEPYRVGLRIDDIRFVR